MRCLTKGCWRKAVDGDWHNGTMCDKHSEEMAQTLQQQGINPATALDQGEAYKIREANRNFPWPVGGP